MYLLKSDLRHPRHSLLLRYYFLTNKRLEKLPALLNACLSGWWLGILRREELHLVDQAYYDDRIITKYCSEAYNRRGLRTWEKEMLETYFRDCKSLLVAAAGGGREVLALEKIGYKVDGFECHPRLLEYANELLRKDGLTSNLQLAARDECPSSGRTYDGLIVGWGAYTHIQGRKERIEFLKQLRAQTTATSPILLSFYTRDFDTLNLKIIAKIGNSIRWLLGRELLSLGDELIPHYVHRFTEKELASELAEAGFELRFYSTKEYGHAVAAASALL